jgi:hypothetical protein
MGNNGASASMPTMKLGEIVVKILRGGTMVPIAVDGLRLYRDSTLTPKDLSKDLADFIVKHELGMAEDILRGRGRMVLEKGNGVREFVFTDGITIRPKL